MSLEQGDRVRWNGKSGEILRIDEKPGNQPDLLNIRTLDDDLVQKPTTQVEKLLTVPEKLNNEQFDSPTHYDLRTYAATLDLNQPDRSLALTSNQIEIEPYQVEAAYEILQTPYPRYLIGDEVGLGKTIEAAMVIEELIARDHAQRILIVTPASLQKQWQNELQSKFGRNFVIYDRGFVRQLQDKNPTGNVWNQEDQIITSIDFAKQEGEGPKEDVLDELRRVQWDVVVFDEAHHLTARLDNDGSIDRTERYKVGEATCQNTDAALFLTGTPHKGKSDQFYLLLRLLKPYQFPYAPEFNITPDDAERLIDPQEVDEIMIRRLKSDIYQADGTRMFPNKNIEALGIEFTQEEKHLYEQVTNYIRNYYNLAREKNKNAVGFAMVMYQKRLVSSIYAIKKSLENRIESIQQDEVTNEVPDDLPQEIQDLLSKYQTEPESLTPQQLNRLQEALSDTDIAITADPERVEEELEHLNKLLEIAEDIETDSKAQRLRDFINGILEEDPSEKVLVFTEYTDTLEYLRDTILSDFEIAQIHGGLDQARRRQEQEKFREEANVMIATDAAREGLNLQFAHIMVNYDLPWNPIRIDQRMGRLHRYGQDRTVEVRNLFVHDTRESQILELLIEKLDTIESQLGSLQPDVLGQVLEEFDLEETIMKAVGEDQSLAEVEQEIDNIEDEYRDAINTVEENFLIRDHFDFPEGLVEDEEILKEVGFEEMIGEEDIETFVRLFLEEFDGTIKGVRPGPAREEGDVFQIEVPEVIADSIEIGGNRYVDPNSDVSSPIRPEYAPATFTRKVAIEQDQAEFISVGHPLVQRMVEFCLKKEQIGETTILVAENSDSDITPGILATYRFQAQDGQEPPEQIGEDIVKLYIPIGGGVMSETPKITGGLPTQLVDSHPEVSEIIQEVTNAELWNEIKKERENQAAAFASKMKEDREHDVDIKREHLERYYDARIKAQEERLERYEKREQQEDVDLNLQINQTESTLDELRSQKEEELGQLDAELSITSSTELINAAIVVSPIVGTDVIVDIEGLKSNNLDSALEDAISTLQNNEQFDPSDPYSEHKSIDEISQEDVVRIERNIDILAEKDLEAVDCDGEEVYLPPDVKPDQVDVDSASEFRQQMQQIVDQMGGNANTVNICHTNEVMDGFNIQNQLFFNLSLYNKKSEIFWYIIAARELAYNNHESHSQSHMRDMTNYLETALEEQI